MNTAKISLLYVDISQFGYHTDAFFYSKYLSGLVNVTYIGIDEGKKKIQLDSVKVIYVPCSKFRLFRQFQFLSACIKEIKKNRYDCVFICYTIFCSILKIRFPKLKMIADVRTGYVEPYKWVNAVFNTFMLLELSCFKNVCFIAEELAQTLRFSRPFQLLPLGADAITFKPPSAKNGINLLYVGTFLSRNMEITLKGFRKFLNEYKPVVPITYLMIGFGPDEEVEKLNQIIQRLELGNYVECKREIRYPDIHGYYIKGDIGVSFIPMRPCYDYQPPTKNYEYLMYGMPLIATKTKFNLNFVKPEFGVLIEDTEDGFCDGLKNIINNWQSYDRRHIHDLGMVHSYETLADQILIPYVNKVVSGN